MIASLYQSSSVRSLLSQVRAQRMLSLSWPRGSQTFGLQIAIRMIRREQTKCTPQFESLSLYMAYMAASLMLLRCLQTDVLGAVCRRECVVHVQVELGWRPFAKLFSMAAVRIQ